MKRWFAALVVALVAGAAPADAAQPVAPADLWAVQRIGGIEVSPDGRWAVLPVTRFDVEADGGSTNLFRLDLRDNTLRQFTRHDGVDAAPAWSPDSGRIAFVSRRDDGAAQLYVMRADGGEARKLTRLPVDVAAPRWFPDGERIAVWLKVPAGFDGDFDALAESLDAERERPMGARTTENRLYRFWDAWLTDGMVHRLFEVSLADGEAVDLMPGSDLVRVPQGTPNYDISPDSREIAIAMNSAAPPYPAMHNDLFLLQADGSGELANLTDGSPAHDLDPVFSRDGRYIYYTRQARKDFYADTLRIARYDRRTGRHRLLTDDVDRSFTNVTVAENGRTLYARAEDRGASAIFSIPATGGDATLVHRGGTVTHLALGPRNTLLFTQASLTSLPEVHQVGRRGGDAQPLTAINAATARRLAFGHAESVTYPGADGAEVQAWVVYPPGFDPSKRWPLINMIHGGPHGITADDFHFRWNLQALAAPGYVVIAPNFHGSTSFGQEFAISIHGSHADLPYRDVMKATDFMVARGYIDESRMAAAGGSYGGYLVSWIAGQTDRFAALVNHAGVYNLAAQFGSDTTLHREAAYGATPWRDLARLDAQNPARFAENFATPMLVIHGELDYRVPVGQGLEAYGVLQGMGVPSRLVYYPDENHWIRKPQNAIHWHEEVFGWLDRWMGVGPTE